MKLGLLIHYTDDDLDLLKRLQLESCQLLIFPDDPLSPGGGSTRDDWQRAKDTFDELGVEVSALGSYTNHLSPDKTEATQSIQHLESLFEVAEVMGCNTIGTFAGRDPEKPIEANIPAFRQVFTPICQKAEDRGLRIAIEGCPMFLGWPFRGINFAHTPEAWDLMLDAVTSPALGVEYDPSHLICQLIDPVSVIPKYGHKFFHAHAKDAEIAPEALQKYGILDRRTTRHRMPGLGQADWPRIIGELQKVGYRGNLDIEGRHDPEYHDEREEEGLRLAVGALRQAMP